jgi:hypothetical protein
MELMLNKNVVVMKVITIPLMVNVCVGVLIHKDGMIKLETLLEIHGKILLTMTGQILAGWII